jgi:hypothetical protein
MEERIIDTAKQYMELAHMLMTSAEEAKLNADEPGYIHDALLRLFYVIRLEDKMEKSQELLTEESDEETVEAVLEAVHDVQEAADRIFEFIEDYSGSDRDFEEKIENLTLGSPEEGLDDLLCKLYKCEGIIRLAYHCAKPYPVYGPSDSLMGGESSTPVDDPEESLADDMDVDIMALLDAREKLIADIEPLAGEEK